MGGARRRDSLPVVHVDWVTDADDQRVAAAVELLAAWEREDLGQTRSTPTEEVAQSIWSHPFGLNARVAVAASGDRIIGAAHLTIDRANPHTAWVRWLVVDRAWQRQRVGRAL